MKSANGRNAQRRTKANAYCIIVDVSAQIPRYPPADPYFASIVATDAADLKRSGSMPYFFTRSPMIRSVNPS